MRLLALAVSLFPLILASACQTTSMDDPNFSGYAKSDTNRARTDDPIKALQRY